MDSLGKGLINPASEYN